MENVEKDQQAPDLCPVCRAPISAHSAEPVRAPKALGRPACVRARVLEALHAASRPLTVAQLLDAANANSAAAKPISQRGAYKALGDLARAGKVEQAEGEARRFTTASTWRPTATGSDGKDEPLQKIP